MTQDCPVACDNNAPQTRTRHVTIVGGGLAGLATAVRLASRGLQATILEARPTLGGRAGSFVDPVTGETVDNCQHVTMGCCTELADFCRTVGIVDLLRRVDVLHFIDERGKVSDVRNSWLPPPLHQLPSFLRLRFLTLGEKLRIAWAVGRMLQSAEPASPVSVRDWLLAHRQTEPTIERYWGVVLTSALNESLDRIDYRYARQVFVEGFFASKQACTVEIPTVPLGEFYGSRIAQWLATHGVELRTNAAVAELQVADDRVVSARMRNGEVRAVDEIVLAVPFQRVRDLLPVDWKERQPFVDLEKLEPSPIVSVHFWFDRKVMDWPHLVVVGRTTQWLFRRDDAAAGDYVQAVVSAARHLAALGRDAIEAIVLAEVRAILPKANAAVLRHSRVIAEKFATYSIIPGIDSIRPETATPIANLWLAGDYVRTGWPATMEGAVRSGNRAADQILAVAKTEA